MNSGTPRIGTAQGVRKRECGSKVSALAPVVTNFEYASSNGFRLKGNGVSTGGETLRACYGYEVQGRKSSGTKASANLTSCP